MSASSSPLWPQWPAPMPPWPLCRTMPWPGRLRSRLLSPICTATPCPTPSHLLPRLSLPLVRPPERLRCRRPPCAVLSTGVAPRKTKAAARFASSSSPSTSKESGQGALSRRRRPRHPQPRPSRVELDPVDFVHPVADECSPASWVSTTFSWPTPAPYFPSPRRRSPGAVAVGRCPAVPCARPGARPGPAGRPVPSGHCPA